MVGTLPLVAAAVAVVGFWIRFTVTSTHLTVIVGCNSIYCTYYSFVKSGGETPDVRQKHYATVLAFATVIFYSLRETVCSILRYVCCPLPSW